MPRKVILDMDPGVDDAVALAVALADPALEVVAVTATAGNVSGVQATRNVQALIERIDPPRWPRIGAADPDHVQRTDARDLHGASGLAGLEVMVAEKANQHSAIKVIADEVRNAPGEITLIATGPMTNVAALLVREPDVAAALQHVVLLGGSVAVGGNVTPAAEFNCYCDPQSARAVLRGDLLKTLVPLDVSRQMLFGYDLVEFVRERGSRTATLLAEMLPAFYHSYRQRFGIEGVYLHDVAAVLAVTNPGAFTMEPMHADVETAGELTLGATVFDRRWRPDATPNVEVATAIDIVAARDAVYRALDQAC
ncbi:MAG: nucleoside hydrolase [Lacipirellulaceae bacterium]